MKIIFFGTPEFVVPVLERLHKEYNRGREKQLIGVVTQAPRPSGREKELKYSPVDQFAYDHKIDIFHSLEKLPQADLGICAAYGNIIPGELIASFTYGILNVHPSLLPKFRGASPIQAAIAMGENETGVTIIRMDEALDHGPIVSNFKEEILPEDTNESLRNRLFEKSGQFLIDLIPSYLAEKIKLTVQDENKATYTKIIKRDDGYVDGKYFRSLLENKNIEEGFSIPFIKNSSINLDAKGLVQLIKALTPWPGIWTNVSIKGEQKRLKILSAHLDEKILLQLDEVQLEGKNPVSFKQFKEGYPDFSFE